MKLIRAINPVLKHGAIIEGALIRKAVSDTSLTELFYGMLNRETDGQINRRRVPFTQNSTANFTVAPILQPRR